MRTYANQPIGTVPRARDLRRNAPEPERRLLRGLREAFLNQQGYRVLRVSNADVMENLTGVLEQISLSFQEREGAALARQKGGDRPRIVSIAETPVLSSPARGYAAPPLARRERGSEVMR